MWKIGCCGFPRKREQCFRVFDVIEIQETFYQPPRPETLARTSAPFFGSSGWNDWGKSLFADGHVGM